MPGLDVSEALTDPFFMDTFTVNRCAETISSKGRSVITRTPILDVGGVVCVAHGNDLERLPESQRMGRNLSIVTKFPLIGPAPGKQPDEIIWRGGTYLIKSLDPYPQYGAGFVQAIAGSTDVIDTPTP